MTGEVALFLIARNYPTHLQPRMYAVLSSSYMIPALVGPPVAGIIAEAFSWRWVFVLVTPIALGMAYNACTSETMRLTATKNRGRTASSLTTAQTLATATLAGLGGGLIKLLHANGGTTTTALTITFALTVACAFAGIAVSGRLHDPNDVTPDTTIS